MPIHKSIDQGSFLNMDSSQFHPNINHSSLNFDFHKFIKNLRWNQIMKFDIPCDPLGLVITNFSLVFHLDLICPMNLVDFDDLGFKRRTPFLALWKRRPKHTLCLFWFLIFVLIKTLSTLNPFSPYSSNLFIKRFINSYFISCFHLITHY